MQIKGINVTKSVIFLALFLVWGTNNIANAKNNDIQCFYQNEEFVIDGKMDEWGDMAIYDDETALVFNLSNDQEYIYVKIRIPSYGSINRMFLSGFTIWFNDEGKARRKIGISFPVEDEVADDIKKQGKMLKGLSEDQIKRMQDLNKQEFNTKFAAGLARIYVLNKDLEVINSKSYNKAKTGLSATLNIVDFDLLIYEARIPLDMVLENKDDFLLKSKKKKAFSLGFEYGKYEDKEMKAQAITIPNDSRYASNPSYYNRYRGKMEGYGTFPPLDTWYKNVYLSSKE